MTESDRALLSPEEVQLLKIVAAYNGTALPHEVSRRLGVSRQRVVSMAGPLSQMGFMRVTRLPKMTYYEITPSGRACIGKGESA